MACSPTPEFELRFESAHFEYFSQPGQPLCATTEQWLERYYESFSKYLGVERGDGGERIRYFLYADEDSLFADPDGCPTNACSRAHEIRSTFPIVPHELVHAITYELGSPPLFLVEGLASVLGCVSSGADVYGSIDRSIPLEDLLVTESFVDWTEDHGLTALYLVSADFFRFLMQEFGLASILEIYGALERDASVATIDSTFRTQLGQGIHTLVGRWRQLPIGYASESCLYPMEASLPSMEPGEWQRIEPACAATSSLDGYQALIPFELSEGHVATVEIASAASFTISVHGTAGGSVLGGHTPLVAGGDMTTKLVLDIPPGRYFARLLGAELATVELRWQQQLAGRAGTGLVTSDAIMLDTRSELLFASRWSQRVDEWDQRRLELVTEEASLLAFLPLRWRDSWTHRYMDLSPDFLQVCSSQSSGAPANECEIIDPWRKTPSRTVFAPGARVQIALPQSFRAGPLEIDGVNWTASSTTGAISAMVVRAVGVSSSPSIPE